MIALCKDKKYCIQNFKYILAYYSIFLNISHSKNEYTYF